MVKDKQDTFARTYAMLAALRENIAQMGDVDEIYVREFHDVLDMLESIGIEVSGFRIPDSEVAPHLRSFNRITGESVYSTKKYVPRRLILIKLDAILGYFKITTAEKPKSIGFQTSKD